MKKVASIFFVLTVFVFLVSPARAGVPLNNLEGVGGVAFNPHAYLAQSEASESTSGANRYLQAAKPRAGAWYVSLPGASGVNWASFGIADSFHNRLELSYGYELIRLRGGYYKNKNNVGAKILLIPEGWRKDFKAAEYVPAISAGVIWKNTTNVGPGVHSNGIDGYLVATKLITQLPLKVLLSGGGLLTQGHTTGVLGYDKESRVTLFGNADLLLTDQIAVGYEIKQGAKFDTFKNANYMNAHLAYFPTKHVSLVVAYVYAGKTNSPTVGLGSGVATSVHYAF